MNLSEMIMRKRFAPGKGVTQPPPTRGIKLFFFILYTYFGEIVTLNLLFLLFCIPIITIPAALCGANRVLINLIQKGICYLWSDFITEFKMSFIRSLPFGLLFIFLLLDCILVYSMSFTENGMIIPVLALAFFLFGLSIVFFSYVFVFIPSLVLKNKDAAKNAFIFMITEWKTNVIIIVGTVATIIVLSAIAAFSIIIALVLIVSIYFSFNQLIICTAVNQPMKKRIVEPYEQYKKQ